MPIDRAYQGELIASARLKLRDIQASLNERGVKRKPRLMVQLAAGGGKTVIASMIAEATLEKGGRVAFLCHRGFLLDQTSQTFTKRGVKHSYIAAGKSFNPRARAHIGMIGSMKSRMGKIEPPSICMPDEGHHGVAKSWKAVIDAWHDTTFIFLSATPGERTDGVGLHEICDDIVCGPQVSELIELGALSDYRWLEGRPPAELLALKLSASDSADKQADILDKPVIIGDIVGTYKKYAMGKRAVYFAPNIKMSKDLSDAFNAAGLPWAHMDRETPDWERKRIARAIAKGELLGFSNVAIAGEGFDLAAQAGMDVTIEVTGLCRRTQSLPLLIQMAMRAMRAKSEPGIILDHCGNYSLHKWLPSDDITWTLDGCIRKPKDVKAIQCPRCLATAYPGPGGTCKHCGSSLKDGKIEGVRTRAEMEVIEGELVEVERKQQEAAATEAAEKHRKKLEEWSCKTYADWLGLARRRNYQNPEHWAGMRHSLKQKQKRRA